MRRSLVLVGIAWVLSSGIARADPAIVGVPGPDRDDRDDARYGDGRPIARADDALIACDGCSRADRPAASVVRVVLGGAAGVMSRGGSQGLAGLDLGMEVGSGVVGARFGA